jgi:hypothetical protein
MPPFEEEGVYCYANVGLSVGPLVCPSVDHMVSADYLENIYHKVFILAIMSS